MVIKYRWIYQLIFTWHAADVSAAMLINIWSSTGMSIDISINVSMCTGRYLVNLSDNTWLVYRLTLGQHLGLWYSSLLLVAYQSTGAGVLFLLTYFILMSAISVAMTQVAFIYSLMNLN